MPEKRVGDVWKALREAGKTAANELSICDSSRDARDELDNALAATEGIPTAQEALTKLRYALDGMVHRSERDGRATWEVDVVLTKLSDIERELQGDTS